MPWKKSPPWHPGSVPGHWTKSVSYTHLKWDQIEMDINRQPDDQVYEFENLEELRLFDTHYQNHSDNKAMELVAEVSFPVSYNRIRNQKRLPDKSREQ